MLIEAVRGRTAAGGWNLGEAGGGGQGDRSHRREAAPEELNTICAENSRVAFDAMSAPQLVRKLAHWLFLLRMHTSLLAAEHDHLETLRNACRQATSVLSLALVPCLVLACAYSSLACRRATSIARSAMHARKLGRPQSAIELQKTMAECHACPPSRHAESNADSHCDTPANAATRS